MCEVEKNFYEFRFISGGLKDKKTLSAKCKECDKLIQKNKKKLITDLKTNTEHIKNSDFIENIINNNYSLGQITVF